nr:MAG TPA: hypothetical protein [Caudoviricetes sp.]
MVQARHSYESCRISERVSLNGKKSASRRAKPQT